MEVLDEGAKIPRGSMGVWTLAWPSIITNLFYATSSIVAIKVVGNLGPDAIAAAVTGQRVTFILQAVLTGVLAGSTALIARNWGANDRLESGVFFYQNCAIGSSIIINICCLCLAICRAASKIFWA